MTQEKEIRWVGSAYDDLLKFPEDHAGMPASS
jgi:phage-related protein